MLPVALLVILSFLSSVFTYFFLYYLLYSIKKNVDLKIAAFKLLLLLIFATATCPFMVSVMMGHMNCSGMMMKMQKK